MAISRLTADTNYLWESPIPLQTLMPIVHIVNDIGYMIPRFVYKDYGKMCFFLTNDKEQHGSRLQLGFLFYVDVEKIEKASEDDRRLITIEQIKQGLIEMGKTHGWDEDHILTLFQKVQ